MFNFDVNANTDDGGCEPYVFGCTDSIMFNYNPLANSDNNSCIPFISGCTDPSMLNYNPQQTRRILVVSLMFMGVWIVWLLTMIHLLTRITVRVSKWLWVAWIQTRITTNPVANVNDSLSCLYDAGCITGQAILTG